MIFHSIVNMNTPIYLGIIILFLIDIQLFKMIQNENRCVVYQTTVFPEDLENPYFLHDVNRCLHYHK
jgi:hypothetical protein